MISLCISHAPHREDRRANLALMLKELRGPSRFEPYFLNDDPRLKPAGVTKVAWEKAQWRWALTTAASHHLFMSDDIALAPGFWGILEAMIAAKPDKIIGLLSNHPRAVELVDAGERWYRTNSWLVGPAYLVPHAHLQAFYRWFVELPEGDGPGQIANLNDDSTLNEWITFFGPGETWHPLPTIVEVRGDIPTTWVSGDKHSRELVSWRQTQRVEGDRPHRWVTTPRAFDLEAMRDPDYWRREGPMMAVGS